MGSGGGGTQRVINDLPEWSKPYWAGIARRGRGLANQEYSPYLGQRIADFNPQEKQAFSGVQSLFNQGPRQELGIATNLAANAGQGWDSNAYQQYSNPFRENVTNLGRQRIEESYSDMMGDRMRGQQDDALRAGVVGGRGTLAGARVARDVSEEGFRNLREYQAESDMAGYQSAQEAFDRDRQAGLASASQLESLANTQQQQALQRIAAMQESGMAQRDMQDAIRNLAYQDFIDRRDWGRQQSNWFAGLLSGTPYNVTNQTNANSGGGPSAGQIAGGIGIAGLGAAGSIWG